MLFVNFIYHQWQVETINDSFMKIKLKLNA